ARLNSGSGGRPSRISRPPCGKTARGCGGTSSSFYRGDRGLEPLQLVVLAGPEAPPARLPLERGDLLLDRGDPAVDVERRDALLDRRGLAVEIEHPDLPLDRVHFSFDVERSDLLFDRGNACVLVVVADFALEARDLGVVLRDAARNPGAIGRVSAVARGVEARDGAVLRRDRAAQRAHVTPNRGDLTVQAAFLASHGRDVAVERADVSAKRRDFTLQAAALAVDGGDLAAQAADVAPDRRDLPGRVERGQHSLAPGL